MLANLRHHACRLAYRGVRVTVSRSMSTVGASSELRVREDSCPPPSPPPQTGCALQKVAEGEAGTPSWKLFFHRGADDVRVSSWDDIPLSAGSLGEHALFNFVAEIPRGYVAQNTRMFGWTVSHFCHAHVRDLVFPGKLQSLRSPRSRITIPLCRTRTKMAL